MDRVFIWNDIALDLDNIKSMRIEKFSGSPDGAYVVVELLRGAEYVMNPENDTAKLLTPIIKEGFSTTAWADNAMEDLAKRWNDYLEFRDGVE